ncbi:hypothetical protein [Streptomyces sp. CRN 30]|uniref:Rv1733c family protein n=1 Tax=Streptomyces sp. CRN 30 TaxID=3075613 RepID=UPI002A83EEB8|nr:hypothetical protein [Streptomyces sp. CRN 30]
MRTRVLGRCRRENPLRRRSDVVEAWTVLVLAVLLFVGAPALGTAAAWWAHGQARSIAERQQAERRPVRAEVIGTTPGSLPSVQTGGEHSYRATVRWTEPGGPPRTTTARLPARTRHGDTVDVWLDARNRSVPAPADGSMVWRHSVTMGACATAGTAALLLLAHCAVRRVALRHRMAEWDAAWARTEPLWTQRSA